MFFPDRIDPSSWSPARRRRDSAARIFIMVAAFAATAAFFGGYAWKSAQARQQNTQSGGRLPPDPAARAAALDLVDEAIRAKHEKRISGAIAALDRARRTDPSVPGIDIAFAELALNEKQFIEMRVAAQAAQKKNDHPAAASVLLGMDKWLSRGASDREMSSAADAASSYFAEASESDFFSAPAWFFQADVLRYAGREAEGRDRVLSALHRFNAWDSSDLLAAKAILASAEAGDIVFAGLTFLPDSPWARAVEDTANAHMASPGVSLATLVPFAAQPALRALAPDRFFGPPQPWVSHWPLLP